MAVLGGTAIAAAAYALEGTNLSKAAVGGIEAVVGVGVGTATSMVSKGLGAGMAGGGMAVGVKNLGGAALDYMAKPKTNGDGNGDAQTQAIRANLGRVGRARRQIPSSTAAVDLAGLMNAIRARI